MYEHLTESELDALTEWPDLFIAACERDLWLFDAAHRAVDKLRDTPESCSSRAPTDAPARLESPLHPSERPLPLPVVPGLQCPLHGRLESRQGKGRA